VLTAVERDSRKGAGEDMKERWRKLRESREGGVGLTQSHTEAWDHN
jgi:hypothetical protein